MRGTAARSSGISGRLRLSHVWVVAAIAIPVALVTVGALSSVDLAYQVRAGEIMLDSRHLLRTDVLTFSAAGDPWLNQQWGAQLVFAGVFRGGGWFALAALRSLLAAAALGLVFLACRGAGAPRRLAAWLTLASALVVLGSLQLRAQLLGIVCFAALLWLVATRRTSPARLWLAVPVTLLWANVHGSFFLAPLVLGLAWIDDRVSRDEGGRRVLLVGLATLAVTLVNPFGFRVWSYVWDVSTNPLIRSRVQEWKPPSLGVYTGAAFFASVLAVAVYLARRGRAADWPSLLTLGVFAVLGLTSIRATAWWGMVAPVVVAGLEAGQARDVVGRDDRPDPASAVNLVLVGVLLLIAIAGLARWLPYTGSVPAGSLVEHAPLALTDRLERELEPEQRFFNAQEWGSWFELALPDNPVFVDSRWEVIPERAWDDYDAVSRGRQGWQDVLEQWGISVVAISRDQQDDLLPLISADPGWQRVYQDEDGAIFVRP
jgi:hypothetical protein